jgi:hypothetical protein
LIERKSILYLHSHLGKPNETPWRAGRVVECGSLENC